MTFLSALHAKLSSQLIREFLREKRNLGNLLAAVAWISALWSSYAKPITSPSLRGAVLCQKAPLPPLSSLWESNRPVGRAGGWGRDGQCSPPDRGGDPGASEPQMHFSCHSEWHCCGRNLGSCNSPHPFQSFWCLFLEGFPFLNWAVFKLPCRYFAYFQPFRSYFSANCKARLWAGKAASVWVGGCKLPCCPLVTISAKGENEAKKQTELGKQLEFHTSEYQQCLNLSYFKGWLFVLFSFFSPLSFFYASWLRSALNTWC